MLRTGVLERKAGGGEQVSRRKDGEKRKKEFAKSGKQEMESAWTKGAKYVSVP
jgi:hypothetical protein